MEYTLNRVRSIISDQLGIPYESLTSEILLEGEAGIDSIDMVELLMAIETEFDIDLCGTDISRYKTIADIVEWVKAQK